MKKQKKILAQIIVFFVMLLSTCKVLAVDNSNYFGEMKFSEEYLNYLELSDEERKNVIAPRMYDIPKSKMATKNPFKLTRMLGSTLETKYSLRDTIPANMVIKNQEGTNSCWTFSSLATLESNLALKDYKKGITIDPPVYDFSERHMEYATSKTFKDDINKNGFNREVNEGGNMYIYIPYLTNGTGAIAEEEMRFENNFDSIYISDIQNKNVITQVNDIKGFPSYSSTEDKTIIKQQMKEHIKNYGGIDAGIHGASISLDSDVYNNKTGAIYCNDSINHRIDHAVAIIGWDDTFSKDKFVKDNQPENDGAWIIKNSWGTIVEQFTLAEMKEIVFEVFPDECAENEWTVATDITDEFAIAKFTDAGCTVENNVATLKLGDDGFMYVSYEDVNIYKQLTGIVDAQNEKTYENIYQYDQYGSIFPIEFTKSKIYLATVFDKNPERTEYLTQVSINASERYTCKVYVNPNGTSKAMADLTPVKLKAGDTETFDAGYHTIEFKEPMKINSDSFVVVLEIQGSQPNSISAMMEFKLNDIFNKGDVFPFNLYDNVTIESGKCFYTTEEGMNANKWNDTSMTYTLSEGDWPNFDTTIKAFTTSKVLENIQITNPPTKTSYIEGQDFDATGMVVKANYANGDSKEITDYTIPDGKNLTAGQTSVTITYQGKTVPQTIEVEKNSLKGMTIKNPPTTLEYWAGEDFKADGMVIEGTYKDGSTAIITNYTILDGKNLKDGQTEITIVCEGIEVKQKITVKPNPVEKIEITKAPDKVKYVVGQNFDPTGMIVKATYENGMVKEVQDYVTIQGGTNLQEDKTFVTVEFGGITVQQAITVEVKTVTAISIKTKPTKMEYIQNKEQLDLTGGVIEILYNDETKENMPMTSDEITVSGFDNKEIGTKTITLTYKGKTVQFDVKIKEEAKPKNSNFDNMTGNITRIRAYYFTDVNKKEYTIIDVELNNIIKAEQNDSMEYYYYLSTNVDETDITDWVKINGEQNSGNKLSFEINSADIPNYEELAEAEEIYLYVKEVATRNNMKSEGIVIASSELFNVKDAKIEEYIDGEKKADVDPGKITDPTPGEKEDSTMAPGTIPKAGKTALIMFFAFAILVIGRISYRKYKNIQIK